MSLSGNIIPKKGAKASLRAGFGVLAAAAALSFAGPAAARSGSVCDAPETPREASACASLGDSQTKLTGVFLLAAALGGLAFWQRARIHRLTEQLAPKVAPPHHTPTVLSHDHPNVFLRPVDTQVFASARPGKVLPLRPPPGARRATPGKTRPAATRLGTPPAKPPRAKKRPTHLHLVE